jgi:acetyl-CoA decarbonylase/synthase, CODH/ACS complex subunit gamma
LALNGLQIQKLLPKTNCKECGSNTCLAFAMKLAAKKANLSECPYASDEAKAILGADSEPPVKTVTLGSEKSYKLGAETVLYRHEKTFVNQPLIAININDDAADADDTLEKIKNYKLERVGEILTVNAVAITQKGNDAGKFTLLVKKAWDVTALPIILRSNDTAAVESAAKAIKDTHSLITGVTTANAEEMVRIAKENGHVVAVTAENLDGIVELTGKLKNEGFNEIVLEFNTLSPAEGF